MNLYTRKGQLELPRDFSFELERYNPLLSDQGDASAPVSLPASTHNLDALEHRERIDRARTYSNKVKAMLQAGPVQKKGTLVLDSAHRRNGISASFTVDNGDLYAKAKDKTLKEILDSDNAGNGLRVVFTDNPTALAAMNDTYTGDDETDYICFPVAVSAYEYNGNTVYQYNNELDPNDLEITDQDSIVEDGITVTVPDLYGVAPFLYLWALVWHLFRILGYSVTYNCLQRWPFHKMVLLHNCSDVLCTYDKNHGPILYYRDLVPSCKFGEFLDWMLKKLHVQPVVNSEAMTVQIVSMETILGRDGFAPDYDFSGKVEGDWTVQMQPSRRITITPKYEIEGTEAAAETFDKLIKKYGKYNEVDETEFDALKNNPTPDFFGLVLRKATGQFYEEAFDATTYNPNLIGTNYFKYDRENSDETEDYSPQDVMPLMLCFESLFSTGRSEYCVVPYIGQRTNAHTTYKGSLPDDKQDIILVQACTNGDLPLTTTGTTQRYIPRRLQGEEIDIDLGFDLTSYGLYEVCWKMYNTLLLNSAPHLSGRLRLDIGKVLGMDMSALKLCDNQRVLPVKLSAKIMEASANFGVSLADAELLLVKDYIDGVTDTPIGPVDTSLYKWVVTDNRNVKMQEAWGSSAIGGGANLGPFNIPDSNQGVVSHEGRFGGCDIQFTGDAIVPPAPTSVGETYTATRTAHFNFTINEVIEYDSNVWDPETQTWVPETSTTTYQVSVVKDVTFTFTAVSA